MRGEREDPGESRWGIPPPEGWGCGKRLKTIGSKMLSSLITPGLAGKGLGASGPVAISKSAQLARPGPSGSRVGQQEKPRLARLFSLLDSEKRKNFLL